ncbi:MAG: hypothetical protein JWO66_2899 [Candidatus Eremiobacteraeota bacterium]|jgi:hypothetical protein|nr:hypothetical protein [Candidatus Eremiobacteraeota bacterium]
MTIMATHLAIVLGAWRLRIRIDIDEPRDAELDETRAVPVAYAPAPSANAAPPHVTSRGRG